MTVYEGRRTIDGIVVTVDGRRLPEHYEIKRFTNRGFEWTYEGTSPQQLALAILFDHLGDGGRAIAWSEPYMKDVVANLDNEWQLTDDDVGAYLHAHAHDALEGERQ
jgi:hypothetical protein